MRAAVGSSQPERATGIDQAERQTRTQDINAESRPQMPMEVEDLGMTQMAPGQSPIHGLR